MKEVRPANELALQREQRALRILRLRDVTVKTGLSRSAIYERLKSGEFPASVPLGARAIGFVEHEVDAYLASLISQRKAA